MLMDTNVRNSSINTGGGNAFSNNSVISGGQYNYYPSSSEDIDKSLDWVKKIAPDFALSHSEACRLQTPHTGEWLINSESFKRWYDGEIRHLACIGKPGAGKTILASIAIKHLKKISRDMSSSTTLYGYIKDGQRRRHSVSQFLAGILLQTSKQHTTISDMIRELYDQYGDIEQNIPSIQEMADVLSEGLSAYSTIFIIVDGLDEWDPSRKQPDTPYNLVRELEAISEKVKLLVTSRTVVTFSSGPYETIPIKAQSADIRIYLDRQFRGGLLNSIDDPEQLEEEICSKIQARTNGMFVIASLLATSLSGLSNRATMRKALDIPPGGLFSAYQTTMRRVLSQRPPDVRLAKLTFSWMLREELHLTASAIQHGVAACSSLDGDLRDYLTKKEYLVSVCGGLIVLSKGHQERFEFSHLTAKDFLERNMDQYFPDADEEITLSCLRYLLFSLPRMPNDAISHLKYCPPCWTKQPFEPYSLFQYAASSWFTHHRCQGTTHIAHDLALDLYQHPFSPYMIHDPSPVHVIPLDDMEPKSYLFLLLACQGMLCMFRNFGPGDVRTVSGAADRKGRSAIILASMNGHLEIVKMLSSNDSTNLDLRDNSGRTALSYAAQGGHTTILSILLQRASDPDSQDTEGRTPLSHASSNGYVAAIDMLLDHGAEVDKLSIGSRSPLSFAAENGQVNAMNALLSKGANPSGGFTSRATSPLSYAACFGQHEAMCLLLDNGAAVDEPDYTGRAPLSYAARHRQIDAMNLLIDRGADVNQRDDRERTLMSHAAENRHVDVIEQLLGRGADVNTLDWYERTPLLRASRTGSVPAVSLLLKHGCALEIVDGNGRTALSWLAEDGNVEMMKLLLQYEAKADCPDGFGKTPLTYASMEGHEEVVELLLNHRASVDHMDDEMRTPLSYAAQNGHTDTMSLLLDGGADQDISTPHRQPLWFEFTSNGTESNEISTSNRGDSTQAGVTPILPAAVGGHSSAVVLLIKRGARLNIQDIEGRTALSHISGDGDVETARLLIQHGAEIDLCNVGERTPLSFAASQGHLELAELLLDFGAAADKPDVDGRSPISYASANSHLRIVKLLLDRGANLDRPDKYSYTPFWYAVNDNSASEVARELIDRGVVVERPEWREKGQTPLLFAAMGGNLEMVRRLLDKGASVDQADGYSKQTALSYAAERSYADLLTHLLERGAKVDLSDLIGRSPLSYAAFSSDVTVVNLLLDANTELDRRDDHGRTPLSFAASSGRLDVFSTLLERGAEWDEPDTCERTPLSYAADIGSLEIISVLLKRGCDADRASETGRTPLSFAAETGKVDLVQLLLEERVEVNETLTTGGALTQPPAKLCAAGTN